MRFVLPSSALYEIFTADVCPLLARGLQIAVTLASISLTHLKL